MLKIGYCNRHIRITGRNNYVSALMMVNAEIQKRIGKERAQATTEEFNAIFDDLEQLLQTLVRRVRKAKSDYDQNQA